MLTFFYAFLMLIIIHSKKASFWTSSSVQISCHHMRWIFKLTILKSAYSQVIILSFEVVIKLGRC